MHHLHLEGQALHKRIGKHLQSSGDRRRSSEEPHSLACLDAKPGPQPLSTLATIVFWPRFRCIRIRFLIVVPLPSFSGHASNERSVQIDDARRRHAVVTVITVDTCITAVFTWCANRQRPAVAGERESVSEKVIRFRISRLDVGPVRPCAVGARIHAPRLRRWPANCRRRKARAPHRISPGRETGVIEQIRLISDPGFPSASRQTSTTLLSEKWGFDS
jgi:hypothetical protein